MVGVTWRALSRSIKCWVPSGIINENRMMVQIRILSAASGGLYR